MHSGPSLPPVVVVLINDVFPSTAVPGCPLLPLQLRAADQPALLLRVAHRQREVGLGARGAGFWGTRRHCIGHPGTTSRRTSRGTGSGTTRWSSTSRSAASSTSTTTLKPSTKVLSIQTRDSSEVSSSPVCRDQSGPQAAVLPLLQVWAHLGSNPHRQGGEL